MFDGNGPGMLSALLKGEAFCPLTQGVDRRVLYRGPSVSTRTPSQSGLGSPESTSTHDDTRIDLEPMEERSETWVELSRKFRFCLPPTRLFVRGGRSVPTLTIIVEILLSTTLVSTARTPIPDESTWTRLPDP